MSRDAFDEKQGCMEKPREDRGPTKNISCKEILPLMFSENECNRDAMKDSNPLVHPDISTLTRYCLGTGLQMREGKPSHKTILCSYHDVNNAVEGKMLMTMTQEAMNVERKFRTIQQVILICYSHDDRSPCLLSHIFTNPSSSLVTEMLGLRLGQLWKGKSWYFAYLFLPFRL